MTEKNQGLKSISDSNIENVQKYVALRDQMQALVDELVSNEGESKPDYKTGAIQYSVLGKQFSPVGFIEKILPSGWFKLVYNGKMFVPEIKEARLDELIKLPMPEYDSVLVDIDKFKSEKQNFVKFNYPYKRSILLYGSQGTGKTGLVRFVADAVIKKQGIVLEICSPDDIYAFENVMTWIREIEPERFIMVVMEDVDNFIRYGGGVVQRLQNILDGNSNIQNMLFLMTTNFPEVLLGSFINRPSRINRRYEVGAPTTEARQVYVSAKFPMLSKEEVYKVVSNTEGFTIDMLKELVISVYVMSYDFDVALDEIKKLFNYAGVIGDTFSNKGKARSDSEVVRATIENELER